MPELPDVEVIRRTFSRRALKRPIADVEVKAPRILGGLSEWELKARIVGRQFRQARRYGKRLYCALDEGGWLSMHFGLTGDLQFYKNSALPPPFARVVIDFASGEHIAYTNRRMIGRIEWVEDIQKDIKTKKLGPDALGPKFTAAAFRRALDERHGSVKTVLMDQSVIAGIGNAYSDELLFQCRLHPLYRLEMLTDKARGQLYRALKDIIKKAIAAGAEPDRLPKQFLIPHRRAGDNCPRCGTSISRIDIEGRGSYFCPQCQPKSRRN